ncbi:MAG: NAD-dependent epimerase/dehydratase family protein [Oscillospiraceae bacterium]|nr:NAD-dependent epimerase/dehydratase family protein [Oscillospiraceae bacterium]
MKILVTGSAGFVGRNLVTALEEIRAGHDRRPDHELPEFSIYEYDLNNTAEELDAFCSDCDFVFHLAGVNRPKEEKEFREGNVGFSCDLLDALRRHGNTCPVMLSSSVQATLAGRYAGSKYGQSKREGEELFFNYGKETGAKTLVYRFPNLFGMWCRPNYNSAVATFCYNTANGLPIQVNDPSVELDLCYIDDVVDELIAALKGAPNLQSDGYCSVPVHHETTLGHVAQTILSFPRLGLQVPDLSDPLTKKLYATYLSYLPADKMCSDLKMNCDNRGSFTELLRTPDRGQVSVNISKPGITKGNHWHHTKHEKFIVVKGEGLIQLRKVGDPEIVEYRVSGEKLQVVEIVPGYTHNIINLSDTEDLITIMWANETFDPDRPDTFFLQV